MENLICIGCPMGCELLVRRKDDDIKVENALCKIGERYGREEAVNPTRMITASVPVVGGRSRLVSVKTRSPAPKDRIFECINSLRGVNVHAPVSIGDVVVSNAGRTGIDFIATRDVQSL